MDRRTVLLIEDNPSEERLTLRAFRQAGIQQEVIVVRDGAEALEYLFAEGRYANRSADDQPALTLLDLKLPYLDGFEVLQRIRQDTRTQLNPVVVLTSSAHPEDIVRCYQFGANSYLQKPVDFRKFVDLAITFSHYWLNWNLVPAYPPQGLSSVES